MLTSSATLTRTPLTLDPQSSHAGLSSVFAAAIVSQSFCQLLLSHPERALQQGYMGNQFQLSAQDSSLIMSMNARSLKDLARQVVQTLG
jgi:hypothetical protein